MDNINTLQDTPEIIKDVPAAENTLEESFSYDGYQVVRGEFFAHLFEPSVTLNNEKVSVNSACIRKLPKTDYVQFLVNPTEKKLAVKPCSEDTKDSFCWASIGQDGKKHPKTITCKIFFAKVMKLMGWDANYRYKILGKLVRGNDESIFVFDLTSAETFRKRNKDGTVSRAALYPEEWNNQFGLPVSEHQDHTLINIFDDYTVFKIEKDEEKEAAAYDGSDNPGHEETADPNPQENS